MLPKLARAAALLMLWVTLVSPIPAHADDIQFGTIDDVVSSIESAHSSVIVSAYTLSEDSRVARALVDATRNGAHTILYLDGAGMRDDVSANQITAAHLYKLHVTPRITSYPLHLKTVIVDASTIYISDRNWANSPSLIARLPYEDKQTVLDAIDNIPTSNGSLTTRKRDSLEAELRLIANSDQHTIDVESESFSGGTGIYMALLAHARAGDHITVVVAKREYNERPSERRALAALSAAGAHVCTGDSDEKISSTGAGYWIGSTNATRGVEDQIDWGYTGTDPAVARSLAQRIERRCPQ